MTSTSVGAAEGATGPTVLQIENDPADQALMRRAAACTRLRLHAIDSGRRALDHLMRRGPGEAGAPLPSIVLLDLNLDDMTGFGVLAAIRAEASLRELVVIVLSTSSDHADVQRSYRLGANSFVTKPLNLAGWTECLLTLERYWFRVARLPRPPA